MGVFDIENTFSIEIEEPALIIFRSKSNVGLSDTQLKAQAEMMFEKISELTKFHKSEEYNFLVVLSEGETYQISIPEVNIYRLILKEFNIKKVAIVEKSPILIRFITNIVNMAVTSLKLEFFSNELDARKWIDLKYKYEETI